MLCQDFFGRGLHIGRSGHLTSFLSCLVTLLLVSLALIGALLTFDAQAMLRESFLIEFKDMSHASLDLRGFLLETSHHIELMRPFVLHFDHFAGC